MEDLFKLIPDRDLYRDAGPDRCRRCAVVGNSGNMKGARYGAQIDANDIIIRINKAPVRGFESDVGSRTTHRFIYPESAVDLQDSTHLVLVPFKVLDLQWLVSALTTGSITRTYGKIMVINPAFMKYVYEVWLDNSGRYPSTGFLTLIFAIHICDEVTVYGFGADKFGNWHHYWEPAPKKAGYVSTVHNRNNEFKVSMQLMGNQKVKIFSGP
ncbi:CMP-N-acetylneuraminate-beta-galactosamide-alpha-2,3-sialyltransferase 1-like [Aplochiton taeniatus]